jgi:hypothetical protein
MTYYERKPTVHLDGTPVFQNAEDGAAEQSIATALEQRWSCNIRSFGALSPVDWYAERYGRLVGVLELKARTHAHRTHATVFLNVRKWLALSLASVGLGCPALFVVRFTDRICWTRLHEIDTSRHRIGGCLRIVKSVNDIEPIIEVSVASMHVLGLVAAE